MSAAVKFIDLRAIRPVETTTGETQLRYIGASCPAWQGLIGTVILAYTFDGDMTCYRVRIDEHTIETWMDCEVEAVYRVS